MSLSERVDAAIDAALERRIVGSVVLVSRDGERVYSRSAGYADREAGQPVAENTIFRLASVTKPVVAATALRLVDLGKLSLDDAVTATLPWFAPVAPDGSTPPIRLRQLLAHISGLTGRPAGVYSGSDPAESITLEENLRRFARYPLAAMPGTVWHYGMSIDIVGAMVEAVCGQSLGEAVAELVTGPLGMADTRFGVTDPSRLAVPYADGEDRPFRMGDPQRVVSRDGNVSTFSPGRIFDGRTPQSGGSGMAGTAGDVLKLLEALRTDFLSPALRDQAFSNQIGTISRPAAPGESFGFIGAVVEDPAISGWPVKGMLHWGGVWGNNWIIEPTSGTVVVVCTNTMYEGDNGRFREEIRDAVFG